MKKWLRLIVICFILSFGIMAVLSFYSLRQFSTFSEYTNQVDHTNRVITQLYKIESTVKEFDIKERDYMLTHDTGFYNELFASVPTIYPAIEELRTLTEDNPEQQRTMILLRGAIAMRIANFRNNVRYADTAKSSTLSPHFYEGKRIKDECLQYLNEMMSKEDLVLQKRFKNKEYYKHIASNTLRYLMSIFGLINIILFVLILREFKKRMANQDILRTKLIDLKRSHAELEQIAFASSHDLQEPLRKIRVFSDRLSRLYKNDTTNESHIITERIIASANHMHELIEDLGNLVGLIKEEDEMHAVDLNYTVKNILADMQEKINKKDILIHLEVLPEIKGYDRQLKLLFKSLLDNSIKFSRDGVESVINIRADKTNGAELINFHKQISEKNFYRITISDNGIGFDNKFIAKIFQLFQQLHSAEAGYGGRGIGLAICQRVMVNHEGYITAHGHPEVGATFKLFFPIA